jgi:Type II secretion system (T2SS), protein G
MRKIAFVLALAVAGSTFAAPKSDRKSDLVNELIQLTRVNDTGLEALVLLFMQDATGSDADEAKKLIEDLRSDGRVQTAVTKATFEILSERLNEKQLKSLVSFFKSDAGRAYSNAVSVLTKERPARLVGALAAPPETVERSRQQRTMADMRTLATASEAYATDFNKYPDAKRIDDLRPILVPTYIRVLPTSDAWGTPFAYLVSPDHQRYRFASAGPDKKFDPSSLQLGTSPAKSDDVVFEDGKFLLGPEGINQQ